ncbi:MAG: M6 family metalloprotease domain-containing protein, partial [Paludibacteraceae bacterium]|nr:M6 family metalloprotease domain-containing protein [Paludibacteraceae bacterium]
IYAGKGEADGGEESTIWPHNWDIYSASYYGNCTYPKSEWKVDGKTINTYAMSAELEGAGTLGGIGTLCHEFGHVMGLPDLYDTDYSTNYEDFLTPNEWDIMDGGAYNGGGHCPPNYNVWAKYFFGWVKPVNLQKTPQNITLIANGETNYNAYYLNSSGADKTATTGGWCYYLENRQQKGWDKFLPAHGMVIWQVNYNKTAWANNVPNNTSTTDSPLFTIICSSGKYIGNNNGKGNVFGGSSSVTSWKGFPDQPLLNIKETNGIITATYIAEPITVTWMVDGEVIEMKEYAPDGSQDLVLPTATVTPCGATTFVGWTIEANWADPFILPTDLFTTPNGKVTKSITYHALFQ